MGGQPSRTRQRLRRIVTLPPFWLAIARSGSPSPSKSPDTMPLGFGPVDSGLLGRLEEVEQAVVAQDRHGRVEVVPRREILVGVAVEVGRRQAQRAPADRLGAGGGLDEVREPVVAKDRDVLRARALVDDRQIGRRVPVEPSGDDVLREAAAVSGLPGASVKFAEPLLRNTVMLLPC